MFNNLYIRNRRKLSERLGQGNIAIVCPAGVVTRNGNQPYPYRQSSNLIYLTGIHQEDTFLFLFPSCPKPEYREILFIRHVAKKDIIWEGKKLTKKEAMQISGIDSIMWTKDIFRVINPLLKSASKIFLEMGGEVPPKKSFFSNSFHFYLDFRKKFPKKSVLKLVPEIYKLRLIKEKEEILMMKEAVSVTRTAFLEILKFVKPGVYEFEIESEITRILTRHNRLSHSYLPIVATGSNANVLHYNKNNYRLEKNDLLLFDFGAEFNGYASDLSRTVPVSGKFSKRQADVYKSVLKILKHATKLMAKGNTIDNLNKQVGVMMEEEMLKLKLITQNDIRKQTAAIPAYKKFYPHGISHFMGLDVHDCGTKSTPFEKGMVLSCEPGIYIPHEKFGVRLENDILIDDEPVDLTKEIPVEIEEIENLVHH